MPFVFGDAFELTTAPERALSAAMGCLWRNFIHTGDPNQPPPSRAADAAVGAADGCSGLPQWPRFVAGGKEQTLVLDTAAIAPATNLKVPQCDLFFPEG